MTDNQQSKAEEVTSSKLLLEQLHELDNYLLDRRDRVGRHEGGEMAYENAARLLRKILKDQKEPEVEWGVQYLDGNERLQTWWGFTSDPRLPRYIDGKEYPPQIEADGTIYVTDDPGWVEAVSKRSKPIHTAPWEPFVEASEKDKA